MRQIPELNAIRGMAAVGVVLFHAYPSVFFLGWSCVDLFFVLSGFLITSIIIENHTKDGFLIAFYLRRALRIWPVYYLTLFAVLALNFLCKRGYGTNGLFEHLLFLQNIQGYWKASVPSFPQPFSPSWSVAVEEQFYLVWPALLLVIGARRIPFVVGLVLIATVAARAAGIPFNLLLGRGDGLAFGCLLGFVVSEQRYSLNVRRILPLLGSLSFFYLLILALVWWRHPEPRWTVPTFFAFGLFFFSAIGLIVHNSGHRWLAFLRSRWLLYLGLISYSLYLTHVPVFNYFPVIARTLHLPLPSVFVWVAVFAVPTLSYVLVERPMLRFKAVVPYGRREEDRRESVNPLLDVAQQLGSERAQ
jgi:peptidoglycan/LPS O-acetylase OafA/YrhL